MELKNDHHEGQQSSVFHGEEFFVTRILAREVSRGQSSRSFYRATKGVPFKWETSPGTPKNPREDDDQIFPLCPSPLMQSVGLPLPNFEDRDHETKEHALKTSIVSSLKRIVTKNIIGGISKKVEKLGSRISKHQGSSMFGDSNGESVVSASFSSYSTLSSNSRVLDTPTVDDPFCCDLSDIRTILDEGSTRVYFCSHHKTAFAVENDNSFLSRIKSRVSASDQFSGGEQMPAGIPFIWETHPATPKTPSEDELIPRPSSPAVHRHNGREEVKDYSTWKRVQFWRRGKKESEDVKAENVEISRCDKEFESSFRRQSASRTRGLSNLSCSPWSGTDFAVLTLRKFKSYTS